MNKTIGEWIRYYEERYGRFYQIRLENQNEEPRVYYWWEKVPVEFLELQAKRVWCRPCFDDHNLRDRELMIAY